MNLDYRIMDSHQRWKRPPRSSSPTVHQRPMFLHEIMSFTTTSKCFLNISRDGATTTSLGSPFQCLITLLEKKFLLISNLNLSWLNLRPFPLLLSLVMQEKRPTSTLPQPPFRQLQRAIRLPLSILIPRMNKPCSLSCSS